LANVSGFDRAGALPSGPISYKTAISDLILDDLGQVEALFRSNLDSSLRIVEELGEFVANGGGKRVRPTLHLLCARLCGHAGPHRILLATVLEFIHSATLIHDDVIDEATTRRGHESLNFRWGNSVTVLFGDYLFAKAMELALQAGSLPVMEKLAEVTLRMTEGEMLQTRYAGRLDLTTEEYLDLVERKTAALFACCCELAALLAGVDERRTRALSEYGLNLGMAFQLVDDLLDLTGDSDSLGKPAASDLREGKATLAVIDLLSSESPLAAEGRELAARIMERGVPGTPEIARLNDLLHRSGALRRARGRAESYARASLANLNLFPDGSARRALSILPDLLLSRDH
jgi:octaprenyl-diphosphate synthase